MKWSRNVMPFDQVVSPASCHYCFHCVTLAQRIQEDPSWAHFIDNLLPWMCLSRSLYVKVSFNGLLYLVGRRVLTIGSTSYWSARYPLPYILRDSTWMGLNMNEYIRLWILSFGIVNDSIFSNFPIWAIFRRALTFPDLEMGHAFDSLSLVQVNDKSYDQNLH